MRIGNVARCHKGIVGLITGKRKLRGGGIPLFTGVALTPCTEQLWQSCRPVFVAASLDDWVKIRDRELTVTRRNLS